VFRGGNIGKRDANEAFADAIRAAIKSDGFQLLFQPIVALKGEDGEQFQALLRLRSDNGKLYTAAEIVPFAESHGLIGDVDRWVLSRSMMVLAERERQKRPVRLFVSQAIEAAGDPQRAGWIRQMLETRRVSGERLVIEFRVSDALAHLRDLADFAAAVRKLGIAVSLAGFEGGAAAFQLLDRVKIDFVKVGPRYVEEGSKDPARRQELQSLVATAHERGCDVIAPRIEDARAAAWLWTAGIDYIQGDFVQKAGQDLNYDFHASTH
ncbi:MAG TPA: EAL domain-containing protein, partial [Rudaea sp.]